MQIGNLRHRILIESFTATANEFGEPVQSWSTVGTFWGEIQTLGGSEGMSTRQLFATAEYKISLRYNSTITPKMRATTPEGLVLDIQSVSDPDGKKLETVLMCSRRDNE